MTFPENWTAQQIILKAPEPARTPTASAGTGRPLDALVEEDADPKDGGFRIGGDIEWLRQQFGDLYEPGDEIWFYRSDERSWGMLAGQMGYVLLRDGTQLRDVVSMLS